MSKAVPTASTMREEDIRPVALFDEYLELSRRDIDDFFANRDAFIETGCPACGETARRRGLEKFGFTYAACSRCGSLYVTPRPTPELLDAYYRESRAARFWSTHFYRQTAAARREKMFRPRAELVATIARDHGIAGTATIIDVGAGYGLFLEEMRRQLPEAHVIGIEPNGDLAAHSEHAGFEIIRSPLEQVPAGAAKGDVITAFEVLEHVYDPLQFLVAMHARLRAGGLALVTTLTCTGFDIQVLWERSKSVYPPHHINLISVPGMERLFERAGMRIVELSTPGRLDVDIVGNMRREDPSIDLPRWIHTLLDSEAPVRDSFQRFLAEQRLSSHIRIIAQAAE